jgi:hypothetical protein
VKKQLALWGIFAAVVIAGAVALDPVRPSKPHESVEPEPAPAPPEPAPPPAPRKRPRLRRPEAKAPPPRKATPDEEKKEEALIQEAATPTNPDEERARALEALDAALLEEQQVDELAEIAAHAGVDAPIRRAALETLLEVAADGNEAARLRALEVFARVQADAEEEAALASYLAAEEEAVRARAALALGDVEPEGQQQALEALERSFRSESSAAVQDAIAMAIVRAGRERAAAILDRLAEGASEGQAQTLARHRASIAPPAGEPTKDKE